MTELERMGERARRSARKLADLSTGQKNAALEAVAFALEQKTEEILAENEKDIAAAAENGIRDAMVDRLRLTEDRVSAMAEATRYVAGLDDPVGKVLGGDIRPNGLEIRRISVPLGVVGIIFESRPNVTVDCAVLCLKSGNACILRGGRDAIHSNRYLTLLMREAIESIGLPADAVQLVQDTARETANEMMRLSKYIDVLIPRGGAGLIQTVVQNATVPVIETGAGVCHVFVDESADADMAISIVDNAKTSRPSVCNAMETLLIHESRAETLLPRIKERLDRHSVEWRGCGKARIILGDGVKPATDEDYATEYNDCIMNCRVVHSLEEAVNHIDRYSTRHSEAIVTRDYTNARRFTQLVDSAAVYVNASTRYTDGGEFGLGAEIGISTQKLHARGPMGLTHLTSSKYIIYGDGQIR